MYSGSLTKPVPSYQAPPVKAIVCGGELRDEVEGSVEETCSAGAAG